MHLLRIEDLKSEQINEIFVLADFLKITPKPYLTGKTIVCFFPEASIRTRIAFEKGIKQLGGECILIPSITLEKKEALKDVVSYIECFADAIVIRCDNQEVILEISKYAKVPVVNAMTKNDHPCEVLADLYSIRNRREHYQDLEYTFVGPIGNISRSWMEMAKVMNLKFNHVCTKEHQIKENDCNYNFYTMLEEDLLKRSDIILTDSIPNELKTEDYIHHYQITLERMQKTKDQALLNPCPPFYRGEEVCRDVIESQYFVGYQFKENLLYISQAILLYSLGMVELT